MTAAIEAARTGKPSWAWTAGSHIALAAAAAATSTRPFPDAAATHGGPTVAGESDLRCPRPTRGADSTLRLSANSENPTFAAVARWRLPPRKCRYLFRAVLARRGSSASASSSPVPALRVEVGECSRFDARRLDEGMHVGDLQPENAAHLVGGQHPASMKR